MARGKEPGPEGEGLTVESLAFVLVGPFAEPKALAKWAHAEFRKTAAVAFVAVDSGLAPLLASGLPAALTIGDMDGPGAMATARANRVTPFIRLERAKERSDLAVALDFCAKQGARTLYAFGFQGHRPDHDFAAHLEFSNASRRIPSVVSIGEKGAVFYLAARFSRLKLRATAIEALRTAASPPKSRRGPRARTRFASVFPIGGTASGVRVRGLRFPVMNGILSVTSQGLSNEIRGLEVEVCLAKGRVAIFFPA